MDDGLTFRVAKQSAKVAEAWLKAHQKECEFLKRVRKLEEKGRGPAIGEGPTYTFTDTSIGQMQYIKCPCGDRELINFHEL